MAQSSEIKLLKRFDQNVEITGTLTVGGVSVITSIPSEYLTQAEGDARYLQSFTIPSEYLTQTEGDARYLQSFTIPEEYLTQTEGDARYIQTVPTYNLQDVTDNGASTTNSVLFSYAGKTASFGTNANAPNATIADQTNYIQIVASGATDSMGVVFHNAGISTGVLEYVNVDAANSYFNFRTDESSWNLRIGGGVTLTPSRILMQSVHSKQKIGLYGDVGTGGEWIGTSNATLELSGANINLNGANGTGTPNLKMGDTIVIDANRIITATNYKIGSNVVINSDRDVTGVDITAAGFIQSYGILYTRNNLQVLNSAGTGWNTWGQRDASTGQYNLKAQALTAGINNPNTQWGRVLIENNTNWAGGTTFFPNIGSTGGNTGSLIMLDNPHVNYRTDNTPSASFDFRAGLRMGKTANGTWWDAGMTSQGGGDPYFHILNGDNNFEIFKAYSNGSVQATRNFWVQNANTTYTSPHVTAVPVLAAYNTSTASTAHAIVSLRTQGPSGGDPFVSFDAEGVIGWAIGQDTSDSNKFKLNGAWSSLDSNTKITVKTTGEVGIGQTNPQAKLEVNGYTAVGVYGVPHYSQSGMAYQVIKAPSGDDGQRALFELHSGAGGTKGILQAVGVNNTVYGGSLTNSGVVWGNDVGNLTINTLGEATINNDLTVTGSNNGIYLNSAGHASVRIDRGSTSYDNNVLFLTAGNLDFRLWQDGSQDYLYVRDETNAINMVTFKKGGNVGIGIDPAQKLHVAGIGEFAGAIRITETGTAQNLLIGNQDSGGANKPAMIQGVNGALRFGRGNSWSGEGGTFTEVFKIESNGNSQFNNALYVGGSLEAGSGLFVNGLKTLPNNQGAAQFNLSNSSYNAIRFYNGSSSIGTIHQFGTAWGGGNSAGYMNITGVNGVNFGSWVTPDVVINSNGLGINKAPAARNVLDVQLDDTSGAFATHTNNTGFFLNRTYADYANNGTVVEYQERIGVDGDWASAGTFSNQQYRLRQNNVDRINLTGTDTEFYSNIFAEGYKTAVSQFQVSRDVTNAAIWFQEGNLDTNHVLWNDYYGGPTTRGAAGSGFDGIKWNTYRGIHIKGGLNGAYNCIVVSNSTGSANDHTVDLYAANDLKLETRASSGDGVQIQRDLYISGSTGGSYGNQLGVGISNESFPYTAQDTNTRTIIYATGKYPVLTLNHTVTTNTNHGPTIQFTHNGANSNAQWSAGTNGTGSQFQIGYSNTGLGNSDFNPHNGIAGYNGITAFHIDDSSRIGIGHNGDWGGLGGGNPAANVHIKTTQQYSSFGAYRGTVIHSMQNGGGLNGSALLVVNEFANHSWGTVAEFRVNSTAASDRPSIAFTTAHYSGQNWTLGYAHNSGNDFRIKIDHGWVSESWGTTVMQMDRSGNVTFSGDVKAYSDERLKKDVKTIDNALDMVKQMRGVTYKFKHDDREGVGVIAQEIEKVLPQVVSDVNRDDKGDEHPIKTVSYGNIVGVLIEAIKEQEKRIEYLESIIKAKYD